MTHEKMSTGNFPSVSAQGAQGDEADGQIFHAPQPPYIKTSSSLCFRFSQSGIMLSSRRKKPGL